MNNKVGFLSNNALKIIACLSMFCDHLGFMIFPHVRILRILGRLAFPIFSFCIAEGSFYTHNKLKRFATIFIVGIFMQLVLYFFMNQKDLSIFIVFSCSIVLISLLDYIEKNIKNKNDVMAILGSILFIGLVCFFFWFTHTTKYMFLNYNFYGIMSPVIIYLLKKYTGKYYLLLSFVSFVIMITIHTYTIGNYYNLFAYIGAFLLLFYNFKKGNLNLKYFFYAFYPLHFALIYGISLLIRK